MTLSEYEGLRDTLSKTVHYFIDTYLHNVDLGKHEEDNNCGCIIEICDVDDTIYHLNPLSTDFYQTAIAYYDDERNSDIFIMPSEIKHIKLLYEDKKSNVVSW